MIVTSDRKLSVFTAGDHVILNLLRNDTTPGTAQPDLGDQEGSSKDMKGLDCSFSLTYHDRAQDMVLM